MKTFKTLAAALIATAAVLTLPAQAGTEENGIFFNGVEPNGLRLNGTLWNGVRLNGISWNGNALHGAEAGEIVAISLPTDSPRRCELADW